jgi:hypothetical protein
MTRDEQQTERALVQAQSDWLRARGWVELGGISSSLVGMHRWRHQSAPPSTPALSLVDAMAFTRQEPLRYRKAR